MFTSNIFSQRDWIEARRELRPDCNPYALVDAEHLFDQAFQGTGWFKVWNRICGRPPVMLRDLDEVKATLKVTNRHYLGVREVALDKIQGTQGRIADFDRDFHPIQTRVRQRWINVAAAWIQGLGLPAVELVKLGSIYFVIDGHHRISVARALQKLEIDAVVIEWETTGPLPWDQESPAQAPAPAFAS